MSIASASMILLLTLVSGVTLSTISLVFIALLRITFSSMISIVFVALSTLSMNTSALFLCSLALSIHFLVLLKYSSALFSFSLAF